ncbi:hypothetical protein HPP92_009544 [Vanilla planifolia]|uniref:Uncharacterized protein n=1 Tax=Vanilla planifolia TaxID=51239 RepID=A0A835V4T5_VANPL|nr:hypothetical protein HPP92_009544 [Vanilla planifolia]
MKKQASGITGYGKCTGPVTRARASTLASQGCIKFSKPPLRPDDKALAKSARRKRVVSDENSYAVPYVEVSHHRKRAVLKDISDVSCKNSSGNFFIAAKMPIKVCTQQVLSVQQPKARSSSEKKRSKVCAAATSNREMTYGNFTARKVDEEKIMDSLKTEQTLVSVCMNHSLCSTQVAEIVSDQESSFPVALLDGNMFRDIEMKDNGILSDDQHSLHCIGVQDIDDDLSNPQMCGHYAVEIHNNLRIAELTGRPSTNFMEILQLDITQRMRSILIDWLVEVADEYKLVPDTLYLTVYAIDCFLSQSYIKKERLQLLGVTCMLIASKYEEICAPRVEEFCFITDSTYTKEEVLRMEIQVLNFLGFRLSVPTIKTFLRRFLRAAQTAYKAPSLPLGYLANYFAELSLVEYSFLKFLPSVIAASAVFLARWTLDQSDHPWNRTLEHYTSYKASDLESAVLALQELQQSSATSSLHAIRDKYLQEKYECVADKESPSLPGSLFT